MSSQRDPFVMTQFRGMVDSAGPLDKSLYPAGWMSELYNYHLHPALKKRKGSKLHWSSQVNGSTAVQGLAMYQWDTTRYLLALSNGVLKFAAADSQTTITGTHSFGTGANSRLRTCLFNDGSNQLIVGCTGASGGYPFSWPGTGNIAALSGTGAPTYAEDVAEFKGHLFCGGTNAGIYVVTFAKFGLINNWPIANMVDCTRSAKFIGFSRHGEEVLLALYDDSVYKILFNYGTGTMANLFIPSVVDGENGCAARSSIVSKGGKTYYAGWKGIYRITDPALPATLISGGMSTFWASLNRARIPQIVAVTRGNPWHELGFLVSTGVNTNHDKVMMWNEVKEGWTIFDSPSGLLSYNCAVNYRNTSDEDLTVIGDNSGNLWDCWGDDLHDTGNLDGGSVGGVVTAQGRTGFMDLGYRGNKGNRQIWMDLETPSQISITGWLEAADNVPQANPSFTVGPTGAQLDVNLVLDTSTLSSSGISQVRADAFRSGRYFRFRWREGGTKEPHSVAAIYFLFKRKGMYL